MFKFIKEYASYYREYKKELILALIGIIFVAFATAATAYLIKPVLDKIFIEKNEHMLYILPIAIIIVYFLKGLGAFLQKYYVSYIGEDIVRKIRNNFLNHIVMLDMEYFKKTHSGELVSRIINDINRIQNAVSNDLAMLIRDSVMSIFLMGVVFYQNYKLAFFIFILLPVVIYPVTKISKKIKKYSKETQSKTAELNQSLSEIFRNIETIKAYNSKDYEIDSFKELNSNYLKTNLKILKAEGILRPIMETLNATIAAIVIIVGGKEVIAGSMSVGAFFSFMTALFMLTDPIKKISFTYSRFQDAIAANERLKSILYIKPTINSGSKKLEKVESIEFKNATLKYGNKLALESINFTLKQPSIVGLVGDSGGGKSSFISLLERFYDTCDGELLINGLDIKEYNLENLRKKIAYIPQNIHIFSDTIAANIAYGKKIDREKVIESLKKANLYKFVANLNEGIDTVLQENGSNLSGGQKQRIAIARALYLDPDILLLDEATSALDNQSEAAIMKTIEELEDKFIFIVAHRLSTINNADKILVFKDGKIECQGSKDELIKDCEEFKKLYR